MTTKSEARETYSVSLDGSEMDPLPLPQPPAGEIYHLISALPAHVAGTEMTREAVAAVFEWLEEHDRQVALLRASIEPPVTQKHASLTLDGFLFEIEAKYRALPGFGYAWRGELRIPDPLHRDVLVDCGPIMSEDVSVAYHVSDFDAGHVMEKCLVAASDMVHSRERRGDATVTPREMPGNVVTDDGTPLIRGGKWVGVRKWQPRT